MFYFMTSSKKFVFIISNLFVKLMRGTLVLLIHCYVGRKLYSIYLIKVKLGVETYFSI